MKNRIVNSTVKKATAHNFQSGLGIPRTVDPLVPGQTAEHINRKLDMLTISYTPPPLITVS